MKPGPASPIVSMSDLSEKRRAILDLAHAYGAANVRVFGSVSRGEARTGSDVDLLVDFSPETSVLDQVALWRELQQLLGCPVTLMDSGTLEGALGENVLRDAVAL